MPDKIARAIFLISQEGNPEWRLLVEFPNPRNLKFGKTVRIPSKCGSTWDCLACGMVPPAHPLAQVGCRAPALQTVV